MKSRIVRIGNSRGVRLPKTLLEEAGLSDEVEIRAEGRSIVITPAAGAREGWAEAAGRLSKQQPGLLDPPTPTRFDDEDWDW